MYAAYIRLITVCKMLIMITEWKIEFLVQRKVLIDGFLPPQFLLLGEQLALVLIDRFCTLLGMRELMSV